ncbi:hypothetical protein [Pseudomonas sp. GM80]|uniref:hypothetical protein n=1 Tax=Pseudomonas sp. GM80 TaxID=1144339 RepID=UPI00026F7A63|nr:hypothetical protein [Pseudomonas sp. GM80]EJN32517.1 hypothetical protein PMI37_02023 [Pseudomonas sp. GM80]
MTPHHHQDLPPDFKAFASVKDACAQLGQYLGLEKPITREVFAAIIKNPGYATNLFIARPAPAFRDYLLAHPDHGESITGNSVEPVPARYVELDNRALLKKAASSFVAWSREGFKAADNDLFEQRISACNACPHQTDTPDRLAYRIGAALTGASNRKICDLCGCVTGKKARLSHEKCPGDDPRRPGLSRWGDPMSGAARTIIG